MKFLVVVTPPSIYHIGLWWMLQSLQWLQFKKAVDLKVILVLFPAHANHLIHLLDIAAFKPLNSVFKYCVSSFMLENAITNITKNMQWMLVQKLGKKLFNLKLHIMLLGLYQQVCGLCILYPCSSDWSYLRTVISRC